AAGEARAFAQEHPLQGVVGVDDDTAVVAAAIAGELGLVGNDVAAAHAARDKHEQRTLLAAVGVPVPRFTRYDVDDDPRRLAVGVSYPCVLKPLRLAASRGVIRADTPEAFVAAFERVNASGPWVIELAARPIGGRCSEALRFESRDAGSGMRDASLEEIVIRHALGMDLPALEREQRASGVMMIPVPAAGVLREVRGV